MDGTVDWIRARAIPIATAEAGHGFADLQPLRDMIGSARIVSLGEATHGTREFFQLKHRLLEFCVAELGFTVFGIEANFSESLRVNDYVLHGVGDPADALSGLRFWTWDTQEVIDLIEWMRTWNNSHERKVKFYGFDMQFTSEAVFCILEYLERVAPDLAAKSEALLAPLSSDFAAQLQGKFPKAMREAAQDCIERILARCVRERAAWVGATSELEWHLARLHANVVAQGAHDAVAEGHGLRDRYMADNVRALLEADGPGTKAVVWSHNGHAGRFAIPDTDLQRMGGYLHDHFGRDHIVMGFVFNQGSFQAIAPPGRLIDHTVGPAPTGRLEARLAATGMPLFAIDLRDAPSEGPVAAWLASQPYHFYGAVYSPEYAAEHAKGDAIPGFRHGPDTYDCLLFVEATTAAGRNDANVGSANVTKDGPTKDIAEPVNLDFSVGTSIPDGWTAMGSVGRHPHTLELSQVPTPTGRRSVRIARQLSAQRWGDGMLLQGFSATAWQGRRLRFSAWIRARVSGPGTGAQLFVETRPKRPEKIAIERWSEPDALTTMVDRPVRTAGWGHYCVELDVPPDAGRIVIGLLLTGNGEAWFGDLAVERAGGHEGE